MAQRRMIGTMIQGSDAFRELLPGSQALFTQYWIAADDDGFVSSPKSIVASLPRISLKHHRELIDKRFIIEFKTGVICIKHWLMLNKIKKDRYTPTVYVEELETLAVKPNMAYTEKENYSDFGRQDGDILETRWRHSGSVDKDRYSKDKSSKDIDPRVRAEEDQIDLSSNQTKIFEIYTVFNPTYFGEIPSEKIACFLDRHTVDDFLEVIKRAEKSGYLTGKTGAPKMKLDWILEDDNFLSVLSGKYDSWEEEAEKAPTSFDAEEFFQKAVAKGRFHLESK